MALGAEKVKEKDTSGQMQAGFRRYWRTWLLLLGLTVLEVVVASAGWAPRTVLILLVLLTWLKMFYIAFDFMHLRWESKGLKLIFIIPFVFGLIIYFGSAPDFGLWVR